MWVNGIAIDFGTSRTKLAYLPREGARAELMRFGGAHDRLFVPSLFYLPPAGEDILFGDVAEDMLAEDPAGVLDAVKRQLRERRVWKNRRGVAPAVLVQRMLAELRARAGEEIVALGGRPPESVVLTVPAMYGPAEAELMAAAARTVGFGEVVVVPEPVAAARAWLAETEERADQVVVLDCGGGTVDWAYVRREDGRFRLVPSCPPGGIEGLGGHDVDAALLVLLRERLGEDPAAEAELERRRPWVMAQLRVLKERVGRGLTPRPVRVAGQQITIEAGEVAAAARERFVTWTVSRFGAYLDQVRAVAGSESPPVLLVGGSAGLPELAQAIRGLGCPVASWDRADFAPVLGALVQDRVGGADTAAPARPTPKAAPSRVWVPGTVFRDVEAPGCPKMVVIPGGEFVMGSPPEELERAAWEGPQRRVRIKEPFALGKYAVTFDEFDEFVLAAGYPYQPAAPYGRGRMPVMNVSWKEA